MTKKRRSCQYDLDRITKDECVWGHAVAEWGTISKSGGRLCRMCMIIRNAHKINCRRDMRKMIYKKKPVRKTRASKVVKSVGFYYRPKATLLSINEHDEFMRLYGIKKRRLE